MAVLPSLEQLDLSYRYAWVSSKERETEAKKQAELERLRTEQAHNDLQLQMMDAEASYCR